MKSIDEKIDELSQILEAENRNIGNFLDADSIYLTEKVVSLAHVLAEVGLLLDEEKIEKIVDARVEAKLKEWEQNRINNILQARHFRGF